MEQKSSVLLGCAAWTCDCSAAHLLVTASHGTTYPMSCTRAEVFSSLPQRGIGGSAAPPSHAAGQRCSSGSAPSCVVSSAVLMWPGGTQLVAAGQLWYLVRFSCLVFRLIPFLSLLCVAPSSFSFCLSLCRSLCVPVLIFLLSLLHPGSDAPLAPWSLGYYGAQDPAQTHWHGMREVLPGAPAAPISSCVCVLLQICPWPLLASLL